MNREQAGVLLACIQAFDHRNVAESDIYAWGSVLEDVSFDDARTAVIEHYAESKDWIMPSDVRQGAFRQDWRRRGKERREQLDQALKAEGVTSIESAPPSGPTMAWKQLGDELWKRAKGAEFKAPDDEAGEAS